ncbi:MAG TPA: tetratricopeptide repeat protein [Thermoanaerobaculia bacterium]|nr:tetratricopeptide repeat protein [Thermoanaerobaculia bacterium]
MLLAALLLSGYIDDAACANCHADRAKTYAHVGMGKSFYAARGSQVIEDFGAPPFFHEPSRQYFEMRRRGEDVVFRRWQVAADGAPIHVYERVVDWIIGSGNHARTYLYRVPSGELYQLPLTWYSQTREWQMSPGYDRADHEGVTRRVRHECMFCHNAYPNAAGEPLSYWRSQSFPAELPQGIGCQRCHGPGAEHARTQTRASIVNPARLPVKLRNDICYECHMQPTVMLAGLRRFGRDIYSFRPGQALSDYAVALDVDEPEMPRAQRFEINHHPYRLEQSRCFTESEGRLSCLTCHDPHRKVTDAAHFRKACMSCHATPHRVNEDCTSCHMPKRRPQDVVHTVMTDHFIRRDVASGFLAPLREREPMITRVEAGDDLYAAIALVRVTNNAAAVRRLEQLLAARKPAEIEPYLDLAAAQLRQRQWSSLEKTAKLILKRDPRQELAREWLALARMAVDRDRLAASRTLAQLTRPEAVFNAGVFLAEAGHTKEAIPFYERALALRPNLTAAWVRLGDAHRECGDLVRAIDAYREALNVDPAHARARSAIVDALRAMGNAEEAERYLNVATGRMPGTEG